MRSFHSEKIPRPNLPQEALHAIDAGIADLEIGAGQGLHAIRYGLAHPQRRILAIERTTEKFDRFKGRYERHSGLTNLCPLHADAISVVTHFIRDQSLERIFLLYPNPYPKRKQSNLRWHNSPFMKCLLTKLKKNGRIYLSSNLPWYAEEAKSVFINYWNLKLGSETLVLDPRLAQTHFERKYLKRGQSCFRQIYIKDPSDEGHAPALDL
jgi:tRNA (guanine-N7-)-methyltransferase